MEYTELEKTAIQAILSKPIDGMDVLRRQFAASSVVKRERTPKGFYTTISVPKSLPAMADDIKLRQVLFSACSARVKSDPEELISFHLWAEAGYIECLEAVTMKNDFWPPESDIEVTPS